jgi:hypothetical protein
MLTGRAQVHRKDLIALLFSNLGGLRRLHFKKGKSIIFVKLLEVMVITSGALFN